MHHRFGEGLVEVISSRGVHVWPRFWPEDAGFQPNTVNAVMQIANSAQLECLRY